jgi:hypothetical protein
MSLQKGETKDANGGKGAGNSSTGAISFIPQEYVTSLKATSTRQNSETKDEEGAGNSSKQSAFRIIPERYKTSLKAMSTRENISETLRDALIDSADDMDFGGIHIRDWDDVGKAIFLVLLWYACYFTALFYFTYSLTMTGAQSKFLSLDGNSTDQVCFEVPVTITGTYEGDVYGNWVTSSRFQQNSSAFVLIMTGSKMTVEKYKQVMTKFQSELYALSMKSSSRDLGWNAMMWATFSFRDDTTKMQFISSGEQS